MGDSQQQATQVPQRCGFISSATAGAPARFQKPSPGRSLMGNKRKNSGHPNFRHAKEGLSQTTAVGASPAAVAWPTASGWRLTDNGWPATAGSWPATARPGGVHVPKTKMEKKRLVSLRNVLPKHGLDPGVLRWETTWGPLLLPPSVPNRELRRF